MSDNLMENIKNAATGHPYSPAGIQPVVGVLKADAGYNQNEATQFRECFHEYQVINMKPDKLLGMDVVVTTGNDIVKTCIVDMEE